jgi:hypothetical protein
MMRELDREIRERSNEELTAGGAARDFKNVRHSIGRLAHHVRAVHELVLDARRLKHLFDMYEVKKVPLPQCVPPPIAKSRTNLPAMLNRMVRPHDIRKATVDASAARLSFCLTDEAIKQYYEKESFTPRVHAEVQVLEHFHQHGLRFADRDHFIATSKMACFCCALYFRHHPARCVELESHQKLYPNWGPPHLLEGSRDPRFIAQRDLMIKITEDVREAALDKILELVNSWAFHDDSVSGITPLDSMSNRNVDLSSDDQSEGALSLGELSAS